MVAVAVARATVPPIVYTLVKGIMILTWGCKILFLFIRPI